MGQKVNFSPAQLAGLNFGRRISTVAPTETRARSDFMRAIIGGMSKGFAQDFFSNEVTGVEVKRSDLRQLQSRYKDFSSAVDRNGNHEKQGQITHSLSEAKEISAEELPAKTGFAQESHGIFQRLLDFWNAITQHGQESPQAQLAAI